ncbi:hypothetical protein Goklo_007479 [Gossypium klotzschianum]|uniref:DNA-directed RNA polymerase n=3 Tax=Gossypium TaxID=3633 RepID=A0A7J8WE51_9ROSI|nr:hypothetical protein [Gossypium klotzschianum]
MKVFHVGVLEVDPMLDFMPIPVTEFYTNFQGLSAKASQTLELLSMDFVSISPEMVKRDFGRHSCWMSALAFPALFARALIVVNESNACCVPTVMVFTLVKKLWVISAPTTAMLVDGFTIWPPLFRCLVHGNAITGVIDYYPNHYLIAENGRIYNFDPCPKNGPRLKSGQVFIVQADSIVIRSTKPYLATPGATVHGHYGEILYEGDTLVIFIYEKSRSGDITQGLPKVEQVLQGLPKVEQVLELHSIDSISMNLEKRIEGWNEYITRILGIPWGFVIGAELTIVQSCLFLVNKIQNIYRSQGVQIHNRHIEIIVRQITSKVLVSEDGMSIYFLPEELIGLLRVERTGRALE